MSHVMMSIVLPVHNEAVGIESFIGRLFHILQRAPFSWEVICVENGSRDNTFSILTRLSKKYPKLSVIKSPIGWGNAVRSGIQVAKGTLCCYMVSDGQVDPIYILKMYEIYKTKRVDLVKVWRTNRENLNRLVVSRVYNVIARLLFGFESLDINATPKLIDTDLVRSFHLTSKNIGLDAELLVRLASSHKKWIEIAVPSGPRHSGKSTTNIKAVVEMMFSLVHLRFG